MCCGATSGCCGGGGVRPYARPSILVVTSPSILGLELFPVHMFLTIRPTTPNSTCPKHDTQVRYERHALPCSRTLTLSSGVTQSRGSIDWLQEPYGMCRLSSPLSSPSPRGYNVDYNHQMCHYIGIKHVHCNHPLRLVTINCKNKPYWLSIKGF